MDNYIFDKGTITLRLHVSAKHFNVLNHSWMFGQHQFWIYWHQKPLENSATPNITGILASRSAALYTAYLKKLAVLVAVSAIIRSDSTCPLCRVDPRLYSPQQTLSDPDNRTWVTLVFITAWSTVNLLVPIQPSVHCNKEKHTFILSLHADHKQMLMIWIAAGYQTLSGFRNQWDLERHKHYKL